MKKMISLSAAFLIGAVVFAQDTIPVPLKKSADTSFRDTVPKVNNKFNDTLANRKWPDTATVGITKMNKDTLPLNRQANTNAPDSASLAKTVVEDKVMMKDDKVMVIKGSDSTLLQDSIQLQSGAVVKSDATVRFKDGTITKLKNGQYIALIPPVEKTQPATNAQADTTSTATAKVEDKVVMVEDRVMVIKDGDSTLLADSIKLKSGAIVRNDATVKFKDGTTTKLKNGQFINLTPDAPEAKKTKATKTTKTTKTTIKKKTNG